MRAERSGKPGSESARYETLVKIAAGGMGAVYVARARGALGFEHLVAVKHPHEHLLETRGFKKSLLAEARVASKIRHANVVAIRDVDNDGDAISLVMDYVEGASLSDLLEENPRITMAIALRIIIDACAGLHAAHEVVDENGDPLGLVHRDVSPQNILVGTDGVSRITDFGIAKCLSETRDETTQGVLKGKLSYMAPDQVDGSVVDRRADLFALGVVAWELLTADRLFKGGSDAETIGRVLSMKAKPPSSQRAEVPAELDAVILKAIEKKRTDRFATAEELGDAIEKIARASNMLATPREVGAWVRERVGPMLAERHAAIRAARTGEAPLDLSRHAPAPTETHSGVKPSQRSFPATNEGERTSAGLGPAFERTAPTPIPHLGLGAAAAAISERPSAHPSSRPSSSSRPSHSAERALTPLERAETMRTIPPLTPARRMWPIAAIAALVATSVGATAAIALNARAPKPASGIVSGAEPTATSTSASTSTSIADPSTSSSPLTSAMTAASDPAPAPAPTPLASAPRLTGKRGAGAARPPADAPAPATSSSGKVKAPPNPY